MSKIKAYGMTVVLGGANKGRPVRAVVAAKSPTKACQKLNMPTKYVEYVTELVPVKGAKKAMKHPGSVYWQCLLKEKTFQKWENRT